MTLRQIVESLDSATIKSLAENPLNGHSESVLRKRDDILEKIKSLHPNSFDVIVAIPDNKRNRMFVFDKNNTKNIKKINYDDTYRLYTLKDVEDISSDIMSAFLKKSRLTYTVLKNLTKDDILSIISKINTYTRRRYGAELLSAEQSERVIQDLKIPKIVEICNFIEKLFSHDIVKTQLIFIALDESILSFVSQMHGGVGRIGVLLELRLWSPRSVRFLEAVRTLYRRPIKFVLTYIGKDGKMFLYPNTGDCHMQTDLQCKNKKRKPTPKNKTTH